jgi:hypothetical protein
MSSAVHAKGTLVQVETSAGSGVYTTIPEVGAVTGPSAASSEHDVTSHSTAGLFKETLLGIIDPGEIAFPMNLVPGNALQIQLRNDKYANTQRSYRIVQTTGEYATYTCSVKTFNYRFPVDGPRAVDVALRVLAAPVHSD